MKDLKDAIPAAAEVLVANYEILTAAHVRSAALTLHVTYDSKCRLELIERHLDKCLNKARRMANVQVVTEASFSRPLGDPIA